jgi:hypothetical protein
MGDATIYREAIRDRIRTVVVQPNASGFISDDEINRLITEGAYELYDLLIAARGAEYYSTVYDFATEAGVSDYDLPDDFYRLHAIAFSSSAPTYTSGGSSPVLVPPTMGWIEPPRFKAADLARRMNTLGDAVGKLAYTLTGEQANGSSRTVPQQLIRLVPTPTAVFAARIVYLPVCMHVVGASPPDVAYDGINGWEAYIVYRTAAIIASMQEEDPGPWLMQQGALRDRIAGLAGTRDEAVPEQIADRRGTVDSYWYDRRGEPPWA